MNKWIIGFIVFCLIIVSLGALILFFPPSPTGEYQRMIDGFAQNRINYMKEKGITVKDAATCSYDYYKGYIAYSSFGEFVYEVIEHDRKEYTGMGRTEPSTHYTNKTVYLTWINLTDSLRIPSFFYLESTNKSSFVRRVNYSPIFEVTLEGLEILQDEVNAYIQPYITTLENAGIKIIHTNETFSDRYWCEYGTSIERFIEYTELIGSKQVYLGSMNVTNNLQRPIIYFMNSGLKFLFVTY